MFLVVTMNCGNAKIVEPVATNDMELMSSTEPVTSATNKSEVEEVPLQTLL